MDYMCLILIKCIIYTECLYNTKIYIFILTKKNNE